jgi:hypothetical protein
MGLFRDLYEDFKAWRRGEVRVAPRGTRGRVYARKDGEPSGGPTVNVASTATATLTMIITRADGTKEIVTRPATVTKVSPNG